MTETSPTYHISTVAAPPLATVPPPVDPRLRIMLMAMRRGLILMADAIAEYCGTPKRE